MALFSSKTEKPKDTRGTLRRLLSYLMPYRFLLLLCVMLSIGGNLLALFGPKLSGSAINAIAAGKGAVNFNVVYYYIRLMLCCYLASCVLSLLLSFVMQLVSRQVGKKLRAQVFSTLMKLPVSYFDTNLPGDIISRVSYDIDVISSSLSTDVVQILSSFITVIGAFIMMLVVCPPLVLVVLITIPMSIIYTRRMNRKTRPLFSRRSACYGQMNGYAEELFSGQKTIQAYAHEAYSDAEFSEINGAACDAYFDTEYYTAKMGPSINFINNFSLALVACFGSLLYMFERISLGQISAFILYTRKFSAPINEVANIANEILSALAAAERVFRLLDEPPEAADAPFALPLHDAAGAVTLADLGFSYEPGKPILRHVSFDAKPGQMIAIVGPTGAGKTTIINLLMRFYDPDSGLLLVDGKPHDSYTRASLRRSYAMVLQDTWVFHGTIYENIAYGRQDATRDEVIAAAKAAHIHHYIQCLPNGYDTILTEDGGNISKGQKQMLTIARAMLYDARMLILDEATSNVDTRTERQIQKAMRNLMRDKTCFVIAHRLSTIQHADQILVISDGTLSEHGTHEELLARKGFYYQMYQAQYESFAAKGTE